MNEWAYFPQSPTEWVVFRFLLIEFLLLMIYIFIYILFVSFCFIFHDYVFYFFKIKKKTFRHTHLKSYILWCQYLRHLAHLILYLVIPAESPLLVICILEGFACRFRLWAHAWLLLSVGIQQSLGWEHSSETGLHLLWWGTSQFYPPIYLCLFFGLAYSDPYK